MNSENISFLFSLQKGRIRRSLDNKPPEINYFNNILNDDVLKLIFEYLPINDLLSAMSTCKRFYKIGTASSHWIKQDIFDITISQFGLHRILERKMRIMRLSNSMIFKDDFIYPPLNAVSLDNLTYLDLSYASYDSNSILNSVLERTISLQYLNIAQFGAISDQLCQSIAKNKGLRYLNMEMCGCFSLAGLSNIFSSCTRLVELNIGWIKFSPNVLKNACRIFPTKLERLNISGMEKLQFDDEVLKCIVLRCKLLSEIDLSDILGITERSLKHFKLLKNLKTISLSRCYNIEPMAFLDLEDLDYLNIFGCITNEGINFLNERLYPTIINGTALSSIARVSVRNFESTPNNC